MILSAETIHLSNHVNLYATTVSRILDTKLRTVSYRHHIPFPHVMQSYEQGYPDAFSEASVVVEIENVNEPPRFLSSHYGATVSEGAGPGEVVFSGLEAVDPDEVCVCVCVCL